MVSSAKPLLACRLLQVDEMSFPTPIRGTALAAWIGRPRVEGESPTQPNLSHGALIAEWLVRPLLLEICLPLVGRLALDDP
jgi:hypothetical protein